MEIDNLDLIKSAEKVLKPFRDKSNRLHADVGSALVCAKGNIYTGVCVDTAGWGLCAERSAIAAMITAGEYKIQKIVAVWKDPDTNKLHVLPPCGICRDFMKNIDSNNLETEVIIKKEVVVKLKELIPYQEWPEPLE